jgi:hypothetical protein
MMIYAFLVLFFLCLFVLSLHALFHGGREDLDLGELDNSGFGTIMTMWNAWSGWG